LLVKDAGNVDKPAHGIEPYGELPLQVGRSATYSRSRTRILAFWIALAATAGNLPVTPTYLSPQSSFAPWQPLENESCIVETPKYTLAPRRELLLPP